MAAIDDVDRHMGRSNGPVTAPTSEEVQTPPHAFVAGSHGCVNCGKVAIHYNHRSDYTPGVKPETIAEEASRIVYGDREKAYDDPNQNFRRIAKMWSGTLDKKLAPGQEITPRDVALMLVQLKISRESFRPNRENRVDLVGYALCLDRIVQEEEDKDRELMGT